MSRVLQETAYADLSPADADRRLLLLVTSSPPHPGDEAGVLRLLETAGQLGERGQHDAALEVLRVAALAEAVADREDTSGAALLDAAERVGLHHGAASLLNVVQFGRGLLATGSADHQLAHAHLARMFDPADPAYHRNNGCWMVSHLADAAVRSGHVDEGRAVLGRVEELAARSPSTLVQVSLRHARAVLADDEQAEALYAQARGPDLDGWSLDRARLDLAEGVWLRRRRRVSESRAPLRRARHVFDGLGAVGWGDQARSELRATGESSGQRADRSTDELTAQELQIALMAAEGLSNRDIAARLYLSHRTVGSHLYKIYPKLGITSRGSLAASLGRTV